MFYCLWFANGTNIYLSREALWTTCDNLPLSDMARQTLLEAWQVALPL
jgi:hypothetical protein